MALAAILLVLAGCTSAPSAAAPRLPTVDGSLIVLDSDGVLTSLRAADLRPQWRIDLGGRERYSGLPRYPRHVLAVDARRQLYVTAPPWLFVLDGGTGRLRAAVSLPPDVEWLAPAVDGDGVYLAGADRNGTPMVALVDMAAHQVTDTATLRPAAGRYWAVYATAIFAGGSRLAVTYQSQTATGMDMVDLGELQPVRCQAGTRDGSGCAAQVDGGVVGYRDAAVAATGATNLVRLDGSGRVSSYLSTGLAGAHLRELAVDAGRQELFAVGACGYAGGLATVGLRAGAARLLAAPSRPGSGQVCGDRVLVAPGGAELAVVGARHAAMLDSDTGAVLVSRTVSAPLVDAVLAP
jgi:hypothetical protein